MTSLLKKALILTLLAFLPFISQAKNKTWHALDTKGKITFSVEAIRVFEFKNGLARVYKNTLVEDEWIRGYGFMNKEGQFVIPCNLDEAKDFNAEVAWVKPKGSDKYQLMDRTGRLISVKAYDKVKDFYPNQNVCAVYKNGKMGFVNTKGEEVVPCKYTGSTMFTEGLASVSLKDDKEGKYGYINEKGEIVIPLEFIQSGTSSFHNGYARASIDGKTVLINKEGKVVFTTKNGNIQGINHGLVCVITKPNRRAWGFVNLKDEIVIKPEYDYAKPFNDDGYAIVEKNGLKGVIDTTGKEILPLIYETVFCDVSEYGYFSGIYPSKDGMALANARKDYFSRDMIPLPTLDLGIKYLMPAKGGDLIIYASQDGFFGFLDRDFNVIMPATRFVKAFAFSEGISWARMD